MMKRLLALLMLALFAAPVAAQGPWYAKGDFQIPIFAAGTDYPLTQDSLNPIHWSGTAGGFFDNVRFEYKLATANWETSAPGGNGRVMTNAAGDMTFHMWDQTTWSDGWSPNNTRRVGYSDPGHGWELMGSFDGFSTGVPMIDQGNGLFSVQAPMTAGVVEYKFRKAGDWEVNIGTSFSHNASNNQIGVANAGDLWQFDLDLPGGRFRAFSIDQHGDYNSDGNTDAADYVVWRNTMPGNAAKYTEWRTNFGRTTALTWIAHGSFGSDVTLSDLGGGHYTAALSGLTAGQEYDVQVLRSNASASAPGSAAKIAADASGNINVHLYEKPLAGWADGWSPASANRMGYADPLQYGWEVVGAFNNWPGANDPAYALTNQGNGLYTGSFAMPNTGTFEFKFRHLAETNPWSTSIGDDFGNSAGNNTFTVATAGEIWNFQLDLLNGRWRAFHPTVGSGGAVPEPASMVLLVLGALVGVGSVRRR